MRVFSTTKQTKRPAQTLVPEVVLDRVRALDGLLDRALELGRPVLLCEVRYVARVQVPALPPSLDEAIGILGGEPVR